jgi:prepilin-type N-terminal cleavage/methylation domain-containing protein
MKKTFNRGFTLIELLVVIAIIGILASVVLASLNSARAKGSDAAIKSSLNNMRAQAELYYDNNSSTYGSASQALGNCPTAAVANTIYADATIITALNNVISQAGGAGNTACVSNSTAWAMSAQLKTANGTTAGVDTYCVDSTGASKSYSYTGTVDTAAEVISGAACI